MPRYRTDEKTDFVEGNYPKILTTIEFDYSISGPKTFYVTTHITDKILEDDSDLHYVVENRRQKGFRGEESTLYNSEILNRIHISSEGNESEQFIRALKTHYETVKEIRKVEDLETLCLKSEQLTAI